MPRKQLFSEMSLDHRQRENGASQPAVYVSKSESFNFIMVYY
jgi:hypothetical protein